MASSTASASTCTAAAEKSISADIFDDYDVVFNDFNSWEIIDPSSSDERNADSDAFSLTETEDEEESDAVDEVKDQVPQDFGSLSSDVSMVSQSPNRQNLVVDGVVPEMKDLCAEEFGSPSSVVSMVSQSPQIKQIAVDDVTPESDKQCVDSVSGAVTFDVSVGKYDEDEDEEEQEDDQVDNYDLYDDELVPFGLAGKLERQRMRKKGKRPIPRKKTSKKMPHYYTRPGCVYGKHGLGVQHSNI